jgi:hypothetical protein
MEISADDNLEKLASRMADEVRALPIMFAVMMHQAMAQRLYDYYESIVMAQVTEMESMIERFCK